MNGENMGGFSAKDAMLNSYYQRIVTELSPGEFRTDYVMGDNKEPVVTRHDMVDSLRKRAADFYLRCHTVQVVLDKETGAVISVGSIWIDNKCEEIYNSYQRVISLYERG